MNRNLARRSQRDHSLKIALKPEERNSSLVCPQLDYLLLDASSSMTTKWWNMMAGLNTYVNALKAAAVHSHGILSVFRGPTEIGWVYLDEPIGTWPADVADAVPGPYGGTALYDAINMMCRELAHLDPERAAICIVTDGDDMGSRHTDVTQAKALLDWCRAKGWQVTFIGADFNNDSQAAALGATEHTMIGVAKAHLDDAMGALAAKRIKYYTTGDDIGFSGDEKQQFGGYLAPPKK